MSLMPKKKPLENAAKTDVRKLLDKHNWRHWANAAGPFSVHGIPDRMAVRDGMFMAIEVKRAGGAVTSLQRKFLQDVQAAGHFAFVVDPARTGEGADGLAQRLGIRCVILAALHVRLR